MMIKQGTQVQLLDRAGKFTLHTLRQDNEFTEADILALPARKDKNDYGDFPKVRGQALTQAGWMIFKVNHDRYPFLAVPQADVETV